MSELTLYRGEVFDFIDSPLNRKDAYRYFPDGQITVSRAHELTKEIESKLRLKFGPATHIVLHVEPIKEKKDE